MSYDYRDEIKCDVENHITELLGGVDITLEEINGEQVHVYKAPYDAYDKNGCIDIYFKSDKDYEKVLSDNVCSRRIIQQDKDYNRLRFDCTFY